MRPTKEQISGIYSGIENCLIDFDLSGWNSTLPIFERLIQKIRPSVYVEAGSWKGASVVHVAKTSKLLGLDTLCYAVDFWQDDILQSGGPIPGHWTRRTAYELFLYNVKYCGCDDLIIPIRTNTVNGARLLGLWGVVADLVYIDAGHDFFSCLNDMIAYWEILRPGGVMFGDDYPEEGVTSAVERFCDSRGKKFTHDDHHWEIEPK